LESTTETAIAAHIMREAGLPFMGRHIEIIGRSIESGSTPRELNPFESDVVMNGLRKIVKQVEIGHIQASLMLSEYEQAVTPESSKKES